MTDLKYKLAFWGILGFIVAGMLSLFVGYGMGLFLIPLHFVLFGAFMEFPKNCYGFFDEDDEEDISEWWVE